MEYQEFLKSKLIVNMPSGFDADESALPVNLYPYQKDLVKWGCKRGKAAFFTMTGTGKTAMQVSWAHKSTRIAPQTNQKRFCNVTAGNTGLSGHVPQERLKSGAGNTH
jgi:hypothetical protein